MSSISSYCGVLASRRSRIGFLLGHRRRCDSAKVGENLLYFTGFSGNKTTAVFVIRDRARDSCSLVGVGQKNGVLITRNREWEQREWNTTQKLSNSLTAPQRRESFRRASEITLRSLLQVERFQLGCGRALLARGP